MLWRLQPEIEVWGPMRGVHRTQASKPSNDRRVEVACLGRGSSLGLAIQHDKTIRIPALLPTS